MGLTMVSLVQKSALLDPGSPKLLMLISDQGPVSRKSRKHFGPEKPFVKLRPANSVKLVFS